MIKKVLSINHSNTMGTTGIQADLGDFQELNVFGFSVITAITTNGITLLETIDNSTITKQLDSVFATGHIDSIKIANICNQESIDIIKSFVDKYQVEHLVYEVPHSEFKSHLAEEVIKKLTPIVVLTNHPQKENDLIVLNKKKYFYHANQKVNLANFLAAELATHHNLNHLVLIRN